MPAAPARFLPLSFIVIHPAFLRLKAPVAASSGHWGRAPNGSKKLSENGAIPPASPQGPPYHFIKVKPALPKQSKTGFLV